MRKCVFAVSKPHSSATKDLIGATFLGRLFWHRAQTRGYEWMTTKVDKMNSNMFALRMSPIGCNDEGAHVSMWCIWTCRLHAGPSLKDVVL